MPPDWQAILFDLDGTLVDSAPDIHAALVRFLQGEHRPSVELSQVKRMIGDGTAKLVERAMAATGEPARPDELPGLVERYLAIYEADVAHFTRPFPGVPETLERLAGRGIALAVCTNKPQAATERLMEALGLGRFFRVLGGGDRYLVRKPDPGHPKAVLAELGVGPERAAYVGDNEHDVSAGHGAGLPVVAVTYGYSRLPIASLGAERLIDRFADLPDALAGIAATRAAAN